MPKKNGRKFKLIGSKINEGPTAKSSSASSESREHLNESNPKERYSSFVQVIADVRGKSRTKKQKKKDSRGKSELDKLESDNKESIVMSVVPVTEWESTKDLEGCQGEVAKVEDNALKISEVEIFDSADLSPPMNEEEERSLREFLRTLEMVDARVREQNLLVEKSTAEAMKENDDYEAVVFSRGVKPVPKIPEEIFEVVEDGSKADLVTLQSTDRLEDAFKGAEAVQPFPNVMYTYNGAPVIDHDKNQAIVVRDIDDGILVINNIRCKGRSRYPFNHLDVILEENSDLSDTSSAKSDKAKDLDMVYKTVVDRRERIFDGRGTTFDLQIQPVLRETVTVYPIQQGTKDGRKADTTQVRIQTVVVEKIHPSNIVKIELADTESDSSRIKSGAEDDSDSLEIMCVDDERIKEKSPMAARCLMGSTSDIKFIDEDSERSWSSINNTEDGGEADVESELDSRRETFLFDGSGVPPDDIHGIGGTEGFGTIKKSPLRDKENEYENGTGSNYVADMVVKVNGTISDAEELPTFEQKSQKNATTSPTLSGRESTSSATSVGTVKDMSSRSQVYSDEDGNVRSGSTKELNDVINLGYVSSDTSMNDYLFDLPYKSMIDQVGDVNKTVNVKKLAKDMENDLSKILRSKMKVIEFFDDPIMSEASWSSILESSGGRKKAAEDDVDDVSHSSRFSLLKFKHYSNSSSYENVSKSADSLVDNENVYEAIQTPEALCQLAEKKVMSLPHGHFLLRKIGLSKCCDDAKDDDDDTYTKIEGKVRDATAQSQHLTRSRSTSSEAKPRCFPCSKGNSQGRKALAKNNPPYIEFNYGDKALETWYGMPTNHPSLLLGLSPSQRKAYEGKQKRFVSNEDEAASLLDLHKKFLERRSYNEGNSLKRGRTVVYDSNGVIYAEVVPKKKAPSAVSHEPPHWGEVNTRVNPVPPDKEYGKSEPVGSCSLLAILQNATSDDFVVASNNGSSALPVCEEEQITPRSHCDWQKEKAFGCDSNTSRMGNSMGQKDKKAIPGVAEVEEEAGTGDSLHSGGGDSGHAATTIPSVSEAVRSFEESSSGRKSTNAPKPSTNYGDIHVVIDKERYRISRKGDVAIHQGEDRQKKLNLSDQEMFKQKMYDEYMSKVAERVKRRQQKVLRVSQVNEIEGPGERKLSEIENEFISKVKQRQDKLGLPEEERKRAFLEMEYEEFEKLFDEESRGDTSEETVEVDRVGKRSSVQFLLDPTSDLSGLPKHLEEFLLSGENSADEDDDFQKSKIVSRKLGPRKSDLLKEIDDGLVLSKGFLFGRGPDMISPTFKATAPRPGVWSPAQASTEDKTEVREENEERKKLEDEPIPPVWTPRSAQASPVLERKEFRPVNFESPTLPRKKYIQEERSESVPPPWQQPGGDRLIELVKTPSSPVLSLPKAPNPTVTLLQKAREGHLPRGAHYLNYNMSESFTEDGALSHARDKIYSLKEDLEKPRKVEVAPKKIIGIGPTTKEGIPLVLRSEVTEENKEKWYKRMYDSLHKAGKDEDFVTVKYRTSPSRKGLYGYQPVSSSGYQSEPDTIIYDTNPYNTYTTLDRRRTEKGKENDFISVTLPRSRASTPRYGCETYRNQPGRIEDYEPGHSSISELEARQWWDEVLEIFDRWLEGNQGGRGSDSSLLLTDAIRRRSQKERGQPVHKAQSPKSYMTYALKDSAFISDPQHVFKRREDDFETPLSPEEQKEAYRVIQKGGEVPLRGLRKPAPERPKDDRNSQIEYFPLSPTLTRIRVHKQNITPLSQFPFLQFPVAYHQNKLNYPGLPFGVCNSFSQVQIFPPVPVASGQLPPVISDPEPAQQCDSGFGSNGRKFSVQLQNISEPNLHVVPKPRNKSKTSPLYVNWPIRSVPVKEEEGPLSLSSEASSSQGGQTEEDKSELERSRTSLERIFSDKNTRSVVSKPDLTFSDLKRITPSIISSSISAIIFNDSSDKGNKLAATKKPVSADRGKIRISHKSSSALVKSTKSSPLVKDQNKREALEEKKSGKSIKKVPLSESVRREKSLSGKKSKILGGRKVVSKNASAHPSVPKAPIGTIGSYIDTADQEVTEEVKDSSIGEMNPAKYPGNPKSRYKHKVESNVTEAFRSRSFSPDVRRKVPKPPESLTPPTPPKRKQSKNAGTLKMWSKMMVSYPHHRSRLDVFDSNVKFLREKLRRKLDRDAEDKENENQFGDDIETVRFIRKEKDGSMSIKTDRYVNVAKPVSSSGRTPQRYTYNEHGRRVLSEPRVPITSSTVRLPTPTRTRTDSDAKKSSARQKSDTLLKSSTTYSVQRPSSLEDKRKSVKVTVAVSSKGKEFLRKSASITTPVKKATVRSISSPCPSISSYRSGLSGRSLSEKDSTTSSFGLSSRNRFFSPSSSLSRISSPSRSASPASVTSPVKQRSTAPPLTLTFNGTKTSKKVTSRKVKESVTKTITSQIPKYVSSKTDVKRKVKKPEPERKFKKNGVVKSPPQKKEPEKKVESRRNVVAEHSSLVRTDSFFQNLFLRKQPDKRPGGKLDRTSSVLERARQYQRITELPAQRRSSEPPLSLVTYYLSQKRPVSLSRFKCLDRELSTSRSPSPHLHRSASFQMKLRHFDSLSHFGDEDFGSELLTPSLKERSSSEPPINTSPVDFPEERMGIKPASRLSVSETSSLRTSPNSSRSPSCRRIQTLRHTASVPEVKRKAPRARSAGEVDDVKYKPSATGSWAQSTSSLNLSNLSDHAEYQAYVLELMHSKEKCQRFRDLHKFYSSLERMGELERTTSVSDLRPRMRNEEIIDFDRWKQLRTKERAEAELKSLVGKLLKVQKEKDLVFRTADVEAVRWKGDRGLRIKERSVEDLKEQFNRAAEEVTDVDTFKRCLESGKDVYKPFWRGSSIVNLTTNLNQTTASYRGRPVTLEELQRIKAAEERLSKKFGLKSFDSKPWSSLSTDQIDTLKSQLTEIYGQEAKRKGVDLNAAEDYEITVPEDRRVKTAGEKGLSVRCSSAMGKDKVYQEKKIEGKKSGSISALPSWKSSGADRPGLLQLPWKEEADTKSKPLSENEKKKLSMTLSKEVLEKLTKAPVKTHLFPRETLGALVVASNSLRPPGEPPQDVHSPRTCYSLETSEDGKSKNDFLLVLTPTEKGSDVQKVVEEWANGTSDNIKPRRTTSITELESASASSETSVKTVIRNPVDVLKKVEYYEELQQSAEESAAAESPHRGCDPQVENGKTKRASRSFLAPSHSLENLKDLFGEQQRYAVDRRSWKDEERSRSEDFLTARRVFEEDKHSSVGYRSSNDSIFSARSRSVSPDPTKYYRAYLRMVKCGAVRKLRNKFESWEDLLALSSDKDPWLPPKRYASDPELTRDLLRRYGTDPAKVTVRGHEVGDVRWLRTKYEKGSGMSRGRHRSPVPRSPFTASDRFMPRINVISKTAELQMNRRRSPDGTPSLQLPASPEPYHSLSEYTRDHGGYYYTGEVDKLRRKFEKLHAAERLSILGQMYTSTPDVSELRDIAPYLGCTWVAHRHPELSKTSSSPDLRQRRLEAPNRKTPTKPRPHSSSPVRPKQPSSILKTAPRRDLFADQKYDPSIHRPLYRYQPEVEHHPKRGAADSPGWKQWSKPSVKFKEPVSFAQESKARESTPESPRKYVESEVTIHYKSPVRSETKAALSEDELARRQAESMKRIYKEERRRKYLQELQDMNSRRHADNFIPSQKSPIPLNRYDDFPDEPSSHLSRARDCTTEPVLVARGLYDFVGRRPRELAFRRGDVIFMIRQLDKNWCEGELNGTVGLFPLSYVEIIPYTEYNPKFGRARAKYDFVPQTSLELSARKGEMITLVRKIDENWFEGRIGDRTGIIPASYCQILSMPRVRAPSRTERAQSTKPVAAPAAHSLIHNVSSVPTKHYYTPFYGGRSSPGRSTMTPAVRDTHAAIDQLIDEALYHLEEDFDMRRTPSRGSSHPVNFRVNPRPEPALYQVLFNHIPNNDDELELIQGETVIVLEKCGDGWFIGSKTSGGKLGIFPGTHVRRVAPEFV